MRLLKYHHVFVSIQAHARKAEQEANVQHIVDKETAGLQVCYARRVIITSRIAKRQAMAGRTFQDLLFYRQLFLTGHLFGRILVSGFCVTATELSISCLTPSDVAVPRKSDLEPIGVV